ncbi:SusC/RagA family TonB-linked outer membrane protein [Chitinophagaceae bacterium LWZ2-11]
MKKNLLSKIKCTIVVLLFCINGLHAQTIAVSGKVVNNTGEVLAGATVAVKGTTINAMTKADGTFQINVPTEKSVLVFSYVGFDPQEITVDKQRNIAVTMATSIAAMNDVVVVGYGTRKKSDVTGAVASIGADEIKKRPVANALQAMQGKIAGVDITSNERPGEIGSILIRGVRSINASNAPLYVVDGVPLAAGGIEALNPNDIESIDVLKDASATAIFGSRGANGVVLVTTKQGKRGKLTLNYVGTLTVENQQDRTQMMNSAQYIDFRRDAYRRIRFLNPAANPNTTYPDVPTLTDDQRIFGQDPYAWANVLKGWQGATWNGSLVPTTDWTGMVKQTGLTQDQTISASGGTDKMRTYASFGYLSQGGTLKGQDFKRYNTKFTTELKPVTWFTMGGSITGTFSLQNYGFSTNNATGPGNIYFAAQGMLPYAIPYDSNGKRINLPGGDVNIQNPIDEAQYCINERKIFRALGTLYAEIEPIKGLKYRINFGPDFYNLRNGRWMDAKSVNRGAGEPGSTNYAQLNQTNRFAWTLDNLIYYDKTFGKHNIGVTLLQTASSNRTETSTMTATNLPWASQKWYQLNSVSALDGFGTGLIESQLTSYMARVNYGLSGKYLLTLSGRWDGASQLADGNKWSFFPSAALAWRMDREDFMKNIKWINQLKVRAGLGTTGNSSVAPYATKGAVQTLYYTWGSSVQAGYVSSDPSQATPVPLADKNLTWEKTTQLNIGVDFDLLRGRISGSLDVYTSTTNNLLMLRSIPSPTGYINSWSNVGSTANKGIDLMLNTVNVKGRNFTWSTNLSFSASKERIVELSNGKKNDITNLWFIGQRVSVSYDYEKQGIWQNTTADLAEMAKFNANGHNFKPGDIRVVDKNGDYKIDANNDRVIRGHSQPDWTAGINNTFTYKNWELSFFIFSRWGFTIPTGAESLQGRFAQRLLNYWTPNNPTNDYPSPNYNSASGDAYKSAMNYQDGSFIKLRNVSLGYVLPKQMTDKMHVSALKVYVQATNPGLLYSKISWIDPDLGGSTFNRGFVVGVNLGL